VGHTSRSSSLLGVEVSLARVFQSGLKTGGDTMTGSCAARIQQPKLGYAVDTYLIWIRIRYAWDP
jgi:hypothetical protein